MQDANATQLPPPPAAARGTPTPEVDVDVVSTHVLVGEDQVQKLRELSRRTRIAQSEYLREAVDDLLGKYVASDEEKVER